jgi:signal transduction histidine kinase
VQQRTLDLRRVIAERERLEVALLESGERERRRIGHDLHDGLGQHLTGTALAGQVVVEKLQAKQLEEGADVKKLVEHIEEGIEMTRRLAKGLLLAEIPPAALLGALRDLAAEVSSEFPARCDFRHEGEVAIRDTAAATHLFHITREAVHNAVHHGRARHIAISLSAATPALTLTVRDDGSGLPPREQRKQGLGLSIMAHRAEIIGWSFHIAAEPGGGTVVTCRPTR